MRPEILRWVKIVVLRTLREKKLTHLDIDTLISAGHLGYSQSVQRYDPSRGVKFKTYAEYRIKGAVLDEVRKMIGDERCKNKRPRQAEGFDMTLLGDSGSFQKNIESLLDINKFLDKIPLDGRGKDILRCRMAGMNLKEIGNYFGFSESRASQILAGIKNRVFPMILSYMGCNFNLKQVECPGCGHKNIIDEKSIGFECEKCSADMVFIEGEIREKEHEV